MEIIIPSGLGKPDANVYDVDLPKEKADALNAFIYRLAVRPDVINVDAWEIEHMFSSYRLAGAGFCEGDDLVKTLCDAVDEATKEEKDATGLILGVYGNNLTLIGLKNALDGFAERFTHIVLGAGYGEEEKDGFYVAAAAFNK